MDFASEVLPILRNLRGTLMSQWGNIAVVRDKGAGAHDVVTELDLAIEERTKKALAEIYPEIAFVGEEGGGNREAQRLWLMDPIDGTAHFVRGLPFTTTMLAYVEDGVVQFSAIYEFVHDRMYWAERGKGAYCNDTRLSVSSRSLKEAYVGWESNQAKEENRNLTHALREKCILFNSINAGWEMAMVASGKLDGRVCLDPYGKDYDFAPGSLLVSEAGGVVANIGSTDYDYRNLNFVAVNPTIFNELTEGEEALFPLRK